MIGFSPRKSNISFYLPGGHSAYAEELESLGKFKVGKGCLYVRRLSDINRTTLQKIFNKAPKVAARR